MKISTNTKISFQFLFSLFLGWMTHTPGLPRILTFHGVKTRGTNGIGELNADKFTGFIKFLFENGYETVTVRELLAEWPSSLYRKNCVALTFDDGYLNHWEIVYPILKEFGMTATFFVPTDFVSDNPSKRSFLIGGKKMEMQFLGWEQLRQLCDDGFEVGSHGSSHVLVGVQNPQQAFKEIQGSKSLLEEKLHNKVVSFAYPFGQLGAFTPTTHEYVQQTGYLCACTQVGGVLSDGVDPFELPRTDINIFDNLYTFEMKLKGYYDLWYKLRHSRYTNKGHRKWNYL